MAAKKAGALLPDNLPDLDDLRSFGSRPNSFGDAAAARVDPTVKVVSPAPAARPTLATSGPVNAQSLLQRPSVPDSVASTPRPNPAAQAALTAKPIDTSTLLQKPSTDTIPARPTGATNATQNTRWFSPPDGAPASTGAPGTQSVGGAGDRVGGVSNAESVKRPGLRGAFDSAKSLGSSASGGVGKALNAISMPNAGGVLAALGAAYDEKAGLDAVGRDQNATALDKGAAFGGSVGRVFGTGAGAIAGATKGAALGSTLGPVGTFVGGAGGGLAGAYYGNKAADAAIQVGQEMTGSTGYGPAGATSAQPDTTLRTPTQNPLRVQEARNNIADPGRAQVATPVPETLRFGTASPAGTFGDGFRDMGGGIAGKGSGSRGQPNNFTNIGADGKPTAMSQIDPRTPDQIANGERIKAQTAAALTNPDGSKWSARDNAMMAANLRDGVDPYRGMAQGGQRGGQILPNTSRDPREGQDEQKFRSEMAAIAARRDIPAATARALMRDATDRRNNTADNSTRRGNNAADNATSRSNNEVTNKTLRDNNEATNITSRNNAEAPGRLARQQAQMNRDVMQQAISAATPKDANGKPTGEVDRVRVQQILADMGRPDLATAQSTFVKGVQDQKKGADDITDDFAARVARGVSLPVLNEDGKPTGERNKQAEASVVARILSTRKDLAQLSTPELNEALPQLIAEITATEKINAAGQDRGLGWRGSVLPTYNPVQPRAETPRDVEFYKGKTLGSKGFWNGIGSDGAETTLRDDSGFWGSEWSLGSNVTAEELAHINKMIKAANPDRK